MIEVEIQTLASPEKGAFKIGPFGSSLKKEELVNDGIPVLGIENILPNHFIKKCRRYISLKKFEELSDYAVKTDDILVSTMGTIGRAAIVPEGMGKAIFDSHLFRMRVDKSKVCPSYLCYAINGYQGLKIQLNKMARGAIMDGLNTTILRECTIPLPELSEQKRLVSYINEVDQIRRQQREATRQAEHLFQTLLHRAFRGEL